jgi:hypothetical protein
LPSAAWCGADQSRPLHQPRAAAGCHALLLAHLDATHDGGAATSQGLHDELVVRLKRVLRNLQTARRA